MKKGAKAFDYLAFYGWQDPDMPNLPKDVLIDMFEQAKPKLENKGKIIIMGTGGEGYKHKK